MEYLLPTASIAVLVLAVVIGFTKKINMGFLAFPLALLLAKFNNLFVGKIDGVKAISDGALISGFGTSTFVMLLGVTFLFAIAQGNHTLDLISKKVIAGAGDKTWMIPILILILSVVLAALGPGNIPVGLLLCAFSASLAIELKLTPLAISSFAILGANAGCMSPIANGGIIGMNEVQKIADAGHPVPTNFVMPLFFNNIIPAVLFGVIVYIVFKGYKIKSDNPVKLQDLPRFNREQVVTMIGMGVLVVATAVFKMNVGLTAFLIAIVLLLCRVGTQAKALAAVPWGTIILVCGMSVLMKIVVTMGGITMVTNGLTSIMNHDTATPIMGLSAGVLSWFSSTTGVVMPTLIPTVPGVVEAFPGVSFTGVLSAIVSTSFSAAMSPVSTGGAMVLASYTSAANLDADGQNRLFKNLFLFSVAAVMFNVLIAYLGFFGWLGK